MSFSAVSVSGVPEKIISDFSISRFPNKRVAPAQGMMVLLTLRGGSFNLHKPERGNPEIFAYISQNIKFFKYILVYTILNKLLFNVTNYREFCCLRAS